jgi:glycosyltransferase involved in cell wall biosynthesis
VTPLDVLVDGRALGGDGAYRGFGRYLRSVLAELGRDPTLAMSALVEPGVEVPAGVATRTARRWAPGRWAQLEHDLRLPREIAGAHPSVFHAPGHDPPRRCLVPWVQTLHDVIPLTSSAPEYDAVKDRWATIARRIRDASAVIAVSRHTASEASRVLGLDPAKVHVAHHGVDARFRPADLAERDQAPYALLATEYGPNKGYAEAFAAIGAVAERGGTLRLKVTGRLAPWVRPAVEALRAAAPAPERIDLLGFVPDDELVRLHQGAVALVVTSHAEGFGLPALEAMACATPVVAFANSATEEIVDDAGILVDDGDVAAVATALHQVATEPARRAEWAGRALARAATFSWARCAEVHAEVYRSVAAQRA